MSEKKLKVSLRHISEVYLYEYYINPDEYEISEEDEAAPHIEKAKEYLSDGEYQKALTEWIDAHLENPVDLEIINGIIFCCKQLGDIQGELNYTKQSYLFCCTRAELAAYYRNLGWYYLESYKPELSAALYKYSTWFCESEQAENEIKFLEKALGHSLAKESIEDTQKLLKDNEIPYAADSITLALIVKAGEEAERIGNIPQALDCYHMVFDLTQDEGIKRRIEKITG